MASSTACPAPLTRLPAASVRGPRQRAPVRRGTDSDYTIHWPGPSRRLLRAPLAPPWVYRRITRPLHLIRRGRGRECGAQRARQRAGPFKAASFSAACAAFPCPAVGRSVNTAGARASSYPAGSPRPSRGGASGTSTPRLGCLACRAGGMLTSCEASAAASCASLAGAPVLSHRRCLPRLSLEHPSPSPAALHPALHLLSSREERLTPTFRDPAVPEAAPLPVRLHPLSLLAPTPHSPRPTRARIRAGRVAGRPRHRRPPARPAAV